MGLDPFIPIRQLSNVRVSAGQAVKERDCKRAAIVMHNREDKDKVSPFKLLRPAAVAPKPSPTTTASTVVAAAAIAFKSMSAAGAFFLGSATAVPPASLPAPSMKMMGAQWASKIRLRSTGKENKLSEAGAEDNCRRATTLGQVETQTPVDAKVHEKVENNMVSLASRLKGER